MTLRFFSKTLSIYKHSYRPSSIAHTYADGSTSQLDEKVGRKPNTNTAILKKCKRFEGYVQFT